MDASRDIPRPRVWVVFTFTTTLGVLLGLHVALDSTSHGQPAPLVRRLVEELTGAWSSGLLFFVVHRIALRWRLDGRGWPRALPFHLAALAILAPVHTLMMWGSRSLAFPALGLGPYDYGRFPWRLYMELPTQALSYALATSGIYLVLRSREARWRDLRAAQLASNLKQSRLENLELRLRPHFLFNALNTIAATMYDDPAAADEQMGHLSELLRSSLRPDKEHEVPLETELDLLKNYQALVGARFGEDLAVSIDVPTEMRDLLVPQLLLQPLLENAVRHGRASSDGRGRIWIVGREDGASLELSVRDDGRAVSGDFSYGVGLSLTAERLQLLYGGQADFRVNSRDDGFEVAIRLPARRASSGSAR